MKGEGCVSLFKKKLPALLGERVTSGYLAKKLARFIATLATWARNSAQNCQSLVGSLDCLCLETLACLGTSPYHPILLGRDSPMRRGLTYPSPFIILSQVRSINKEQNHEREASMINPTADGKPITFGHIDPSSNTREKAAPITAPTTRLRRMFLNSFGTVKRRLSKDRIRVNQKREEPAG